MHKHAADALAVKVRAQLTGIPDVTAVDAVALDPTAGSEDRWAVRVARTPRAGGPVTIIGNDHTGYTTTSRTGPRLTLPLLVRLVFLGPTSQPEAEYVWPDDSGLGEAIRRACFALGDVRAQLQALAQDVETRRQQGAWLVIVNDGGGGLVPHGPYLNEQAATEALDRIMAALRSQGRREATGAVYQAQPEPQEA